VLEGGAPWSLGNKAWTCPLADHMASAPVHISSSIGHVPCDDVGPIEVPSVLASLKNKWFCEESCVKVVVLKLEELE
jgi:hypothetical protein